MFQSDSLTFYSKQSKFSDPFKYAHLYEGLPTSIPSLCDIAHGLVLDFALCHLYAVYLLEERIKDVQSRYVEKILEKVQQFQKGSLTKIRDPKNRVVGTCRDFAIVLCSMLRHQKVPSRLRCGFETYFNSGKYEDHWIVEYWNKDQNKWILVDPEIGEIEKEKEGVVVDPYDVPRDKYLIAGVAWKKVREGKTNPKDFGVSTINLSGLWFVRSNVLRDFAALNKMELLPWDYTQYADKHFNSFNEMEKQDLEMIDAIADLTNPFDNEKFEDMRKFYHSQPQIQVKGNITSYSPLGTETISI